MNHIPEVSIITVCRNAESCLGSTMDSILAQTFQPIEYIVIDGASTDRTLALIKEREAAFRSRGIAFRWLSEPDGGIYDAMNKGIRLASGRWLNFMNAGDGFHDAEVLADIFSRGEYPSEVGVIYGDTELRLSFGSVEMRPKPLEYMKKKMPFCHQSTFVRAEEMKAHPFDLTYPFAADYAFFYQYYQHGGGFRYVNRLVAYFESEEGASSRNRLKVNREYARIHGVDQTLRWRLWYIVKCLRVKLKDSLQHIFPQRYVRAVRERNYRRIVKHRQQA